MTTATRIDKPTEKRLHAAVSALNIKSSDLLRIGLLRVLAEYEASGGLTLGKQAPPTPRKRKAIPA